MTEQPDSNQKPFSQQLEELYERVGWRPGQGTIDTERLLSVFACDCGHIHADDRCPECGEERDLVSLIKGAVDVRPPDRDGGEA